MKVTQYLVKDSEWKSQNHEVSKPQLSLLFGSRLTIENHPELLKNYQDKFPNSINICISGAGNVYGDEILDETIVANALEFDSTTVQYSYASFHKKSEIEVANYLIQSIEREGLRALLLYSCSGLNLQKIIDELNRELDNQVPISGGAAGDDMRFEKTVIAVNGDVHEDTIVLIGLYGDKLKTAYGLKGGMDPFGPKRKITKCLGNVLFEIDGRPALELYKDYLGEKATELPASALHFPLSITVDADSESVVRTIQTIDEKSGSLILFGDVLEGQTVQLMKTYQDNVILGASESGKQAKIHSEKDQLSIVVSCVGRRMVLGPLTEEELVEAKASLGENALMSGFYSYSELSPCSRNGSCRLHNQTITITTLSEV